MKTLKMITNISLFCCFCLMLAVNYGCKKEKPENLTVEDNIESLKNSETNAKIKTLQKKIKAETDNKVKIKLIEELAETTDKKGDHKSVINAANKALKISKENFLIYFYKGKAFLYEGNFDSALENLQKSIELNEKYSKSHYELANLYYKMYEYTKAFDEYELAIKYNKKNIDAYNNLSVLCIRLKKYNKAKYLINKLLKINPKFSAAYKNKGILYYRHLNNNKLAVSNFKKYLKLEPNTKNSRILRVIIQNIDR